MPVFLGAVAGTLGEAEKRLLLSSLGGLYRICILLYTWVEVGVHYVIIHQHIYIVEASSVASSTSRISPTTPEMLDISCASFVLAANTILQQALFCDTILEAKRRGLQRVPAIRMCWH